MIWSALSSSYPDQATFVPKVVQIVEAWCDAFVTWLEDEGNEKDVEAFVDSINHGGSVLTLRLLVSLDLWRLATAGLGLWRR